MSKLSSHSESSASALTQSSSDLLTRFLSEGGFGGVHSRTVAESTPVDKSFSKTSAVYLSAFRQAYTPLINALLSGNDFGG